MKILVTGGCGFIGTNFVRYMLKNNIDIDIINLDKLTYAGQRENLKDWESTGSYRFVQGDITNPSAVVAAMTGCEIVIHFAAETHVDRSIVDPSIFIQTNLTGTYHLLEVAIRCGVKRFIYVSTEEVYGSLGLAGTLTENSPLLPNNPYAASKAAADLLVRSYIHTYNFPGIITRCSNNYGPYQYPEKFLPVMITQAMTNQELPIYGDGSHVRSWVYVEDHCRALELILKNGRLGEVYNIGDANEWHNIDTAKSVLKKLGKPESLIRFVADRPGHDRRYVLDSSKLRKELGWAPQVSFDEGLDHTIAWYREHMDWVGRIRQKGGRNLFDWASIPKPQENG